MNTNEMILRHLPDLTVLFVTATCKDLLGYESEELIGTKFMDFIHLEDVPEIFSVMKTALKNQDETFLVRYRAKRKDERFKWVEQRGHVTYARGGKALEIHSNVQEITDSILNQYGDEQKERWPDLFFNLPFIGFAVTCSETHKWLYFNDLVCEMLGFTRDELMGLTWIDVTHPQDLQADLKEFDRMIEGSIDGYCLEKRFLRKDGEVLFANIDVKCIRGEDGRVRFFVCAGRDVTEQRNAELQRREMEHKLHDSSRLESLQNFAKHIAHDINNAMVPILGNADILSLNLPYLSSTHAALQEIVDGVRNISNLCKSLLDYSEDAPSSKVELDMSEFITQILQTLKRSGSQKDLFKVNLAQGLPKICAVVNEIRQAITNLVTNASDSMVPGRGFITISTGVQRCDRAYLDRLRFGGSVSEGTYVTLQISDNGCGMDEETVNRIFEPFFSTKHGHRGLGMSAVLGIVQRHGGIIDIQSQPGQGSLITLLFPASATVTEKGKDAHYGTAEGTVLLVDDDEGVLTVVKKYLQNLGYGFLTAKDGIEALEVYRNYREEIICIILDVTMPEMDGVETFRELRLIDRNVPIILSSGYEEKEALNRLVDDRTLNFLQKPYRMKTLQNAIKRVINPRVV